MRREPAAGVAVRDLPSAAAIAEAIAAGFEQPTIVTLDDPHDETARALLRAGARGVLPRDATADDVAAAIEVVARGYLVVTGVRPPGDDDGESLTPRESDVLRLLAGGLSNRRIAQRLALSEHTVKFHVASILAKFGAASRTEAVTMGVRRGLVML